MESVRLSHAQRLRTSNTPGIFFHVAKMNAPVYVRALEPKFTPSFPSTREAARCPKQLRASLKLQRVEVGFLERKKKKKNKGFTRRNGGQRVIGVYLEGVEGADNEQEA